MAVRPVLLYPDSRLKTVCSPVVEIDNTIRAAAQDLWDTIDAGPPRTVGIAASQIGELIQMVAVDISRNPKYTGGHGPLLLLNPKITQWNGNQVFREGCLSIPDYTANIRRHHEITVEALSLEGESITITTDGFESVVLQHEIDHLNGLLFLDRVINIKTDLFMRKR